MVSEYLENPIRVHDEAFSNWLSGLKVDYGTQNGADRSNHPILQVMASPQRAFAAVENLLTETGFVGGNTISDIRENAGRFEVLPLPVATFERNGPNPDRELANVPGSFRTTMFDPSTLEWEEHRYPNQAQIEYQVTFWSHKRYTDNYIYEWLLSQFGDKGAGSYEAMIPVQHKAPWNIVRQSLTWTGSTDLSELEGTEQRYIRRQHTFNLRVWLFYSPTTSGKPIEAIQVPVELHKSGHTVDDVKTYSDNLFFWFPDTTRFDKWPTLNGGTIGSSTVKPSGSDKKSIEVGLPNYTQGNESSVPFVERPSHLHADGYGIVSVSFKYRSFKSLQLNLYQGSDSDTTSQSTVGNMDLPSTGGAWVKVHRLFLVSKDIYVVRAEARSQAVKSALFNELEVRNVFEGNKIPFTTASGGVTFQWKTLSRDPYLFVFVPSGNNGGNVTLKDDVVSPSANKTISRDGNTNVGVVGFIQPKNQSAEATISGLGAIDRVYARKMAIPFRGDEL